MLRLHIYAILYMKKKSLMQGRLNRHFTFKENIVILPNLLRRLVKLQVTISFTQV